VRCSLRHREAKEIEKLINRERGTHGNRRPVSCDGGEKETMKLGLERGKGNCKCETENLKIKSQRKTINKKIRKENKISRQIKIQKSND